MEKSTEMQTGTALTVNLIGLLTVVSAVTVPGMNMALTVPHWKVHTTGIVPAVHAPVMRQVNVVTVLVTVMKTVKAVKLTAVYAANVMLAI